MSIDSFDSSFTLTLLPLVDNDANADNSSTITAIAKVTRNNHLLADENITFQLLNTKAVFIDSNRQVTSGNTGATGRVTKKFKSWEVAGGKIIAYMTNNISVNAGPEEFTFKEWRPPYDAIIVLTLENNDALSDGKDAIIAKVTVTASDGVTPLSGVKVNFELLDNDTANFIDSGEDRTWGLTTEKGQIKKSFTDSSAETGEVHVFITSDGGDKISAPDKSFQFKPLEPDRIQLSLKNNGAIAGGGKNTVLATVTNKGVLMPDQTVHFSLPDSSAVFVDSNETSNGYSVTSGITGKDGTVSKDFTDTIWQEGTIHAYIAIPGQPLDKVDDDKIFLFIEPPGLQIDLKPLQVKLLSSGNWVNGSDAPADGNSAIQVTAVVTAENEHGCRLPLQNVVVKFHLPKAGHAIFTAPQSPYTITGQTNSQGEVSQQFTCEYIESVNFLEANRTVTAYISGHKDQQLKSSQAFTFSDPWQDVAQLTASFNSNPSATIYANGLHQAVYRLSFVLASASGTRLNTHNQPTLQDVISQVKLIDFYSKNELGTGSLSAVHYSRTPNIYQKNLEFSNIPSETIVDDNSDHINNGVVFLTYYITCDPEKILDILQTGVAITPGNSSKTIYNASGEKFNIPVTLKLMQAVNYNSNLISLQGKHSIHPGESENDQELANPGGIEPAGNFWRQWDYTLKLQDNIDNLRLFQCILDTNSTLPSDYVFASRSNVIYNNQAYFWPNNVHDANGNSLPSQNTYTVKSPGTPEQKINIPADENTMLYFTIYSTFGHINSGGYKYHPVNFSLYDQYGNSGKFSISPIDIPLIYNYETIANLNFIKDGFTTAQPSEAPGEISDIFIMTDFQSEQTIGICDDKTIIRWTGGPPLDTKSSRITFTIKPNAAQSDNPQRIFQIQHKIGDIANYLSIKGSNNPVILTTDMNNAKTWYLKPIWQDNYIVISDYSYPGNNSWYPANASETRTGEHVFVFLSPYHNKDNSFRWSFIASK